MRAALAQYQIVGVRTNVEFLARLMSAPSFVEARLDTALIEREREHLFAPRGEATPAMWELAAQAFWLRSAELGSRAAPDRSPRGTTAAVGRSALAGSDAGNFARGNSSEKSR